MRDEIQSGLRNALERGYSMEEAVKSFITAGYNPVEVKEAANALGSNIIPLVNQKKNIAENSSITNLAPQAQNMPGQSEIPNPFQQDSNTSQISAQIQQTAQTQVQQQNYPIPQIHKKNSKKTTIIILTAILFVLLVCMGILLFFAKDLFSSSTGG